eukprot:2514069-Prymnesium_polylepis.2
MRVCSSMQVDQSPASPRSVPTRRNPRLGADGAGSSIEAHLEQSRLRLLSVGEVSRGSTVSGVSLHPTKEPTDSVRSSSFGQTASGETSLTPSS